MKREYLLGIDIGTSSVKTVLFDSVGNSVAVASEQYGLKRNGAHVEQNPQDYYWAIQKSISALRETRSAEMDAIVGIGLTGQTPTDIFLDREGQPLMAGISWQDTRAVDEARRIREKFGVEKMREMVANNVPITASWSASRYLWFTKHCPELAKRCTKVSFPKDYVGFRMTGTHLSDAWNMRSTVNLQTGRGNEELLSFLGISSEQLPLIGQVQTLRGGLTEVAAKELGLKSGIPVSVGCGDALATMLGSGVLLSPGVAFDSAGTSEIIGMSIQSGDYGTEELMTVPKSVTNTLPIVYGPTQSGSGSLVWLLRNILRKEDMDDALAEASTVPAGSDGMLFLPYLAGERAPLWLPHVRGGFSGMSAAHTSAHLIRATLEGVGYSVNHCLDLISKKCNVAPKVIRVSGGGSRIPLWLQIKADITGTPIETLECDNACALGAAMTVAVGIGMFSDFAEVSKAMVRLQNRLEPNMEQHETYKRGFLQYLFESKTAVDRLQFQLEG